MRYLALAAERDAARVVHAVRPGAWAAACGAKPGRTSAGWGSQRFDAPTCPRCRRIVAGSWVIADELQVMCLDKHGRERLRPWRAGRKPPSGACVFDDEASARAMIDTWSSLGHWPLFAPVARPREAHTRAPK